MANTIYVLNGPNLNLLGTREPETYGRAALADVEQLCREAGKRFDIAIEFRQSNHEGAIIDWIQEAARNKAIGVVINPAGYTTTSVAILDAILAVKIPVIEVHISNIHARESFRHHSYISRVARGVICGFGVEGYGLAIIGLAALVGASAKS
jgi:3-dehydroquinate dehydratase-2